MQLNHLYKPLYIRGKKIRNRIALAPMGTRANSMDGMMSDRCAMYLEERARGGAGLILPELTVVKEGYTWIPSLQIYSDRLIPALARFVESAHGYGSVVLMQLALHGGTAPTSITRKPCIAPSAIDSPLYKQVPQALTETEILELVEDWRTAAIRCKRAGCDGVEIHGCHGYLINQFMSPHANKRTDRFGGSRENRLLFPKMLVDAVRESCGEDFIIGFKISAYEMLEGGVEPGEGAEMAHWLEENTSIDYLHVSSATTGIRGDGYTIYPAVPSMYDDENCLVPLAKCVREKVALPVITTANFWRPEGADAVIADGSADMVAVGRAFLADAHWGEKPRSGAAIRPCIGCMTCHKHTLAGTNMECAVNAGLLREFNDLAFGKTDKPQKVLIIGGGPGGMEAAMGAFDRGHTPVVFEKGGMLGGALKAAAAPGFKYRVKALLEYYRGEIENRGIEVRCNEDINAQRVQALIESEGFNTVIVATGATPSAPPIRGRDSANVFHAADVLENPQNFELGVRVVVIGAGKVGLEAAWMLADMGKSVHVLEAVPMDKILGDDHPAQRATLKHKLEERNITITAECLVDYIGTQEIGMTVCGGEICTLPADSVLLATGYRADDSLYEAIRQLPGMPRVFEVGDCKRARGLSEAVHEAYYVSRFAL